VWVPRGPGDRNDHLEAAKIVIPGNPGLNLVLGNLGPNSIPNNPPRILPRDK
jgi:hypothetical protein